MKIKKTLAAGLATVGLTAGLLVAASPAQAANYHYYSASFDTKTACQAHTMSRIAVLSASGKKIASSTICKHYKGEYKPYYSLIKYR
ncbi:hypothetical protein GCM10009847_26780 [Leucobacter tardus]|uniref:Secreted protein n=1 Tax=Leucobacter tardus TaxID=501483 RepID=A0A939TMU6_9MICO|nr:hypothetical protein [Leucobacter tardus]MBO2989818.1 hypothetical protein [Leucobacter tardus]